MRLDTVTILALAMLSIAAATTTFWRDFTSALSPEPYARTRVVRAFNGIDMDAIATSMGERFPSEVPVALGADLGRYVFVAQRTAEALYPRPVYTGLATPPAAAPAAGAMLVAAPVGHSPAPGAVDVGRYRGNAVFLVDQRASDASTAAPRRAPAPSVLRFSVLSFLDSLFGALGIGALVWFAFLRRRLTDVVLLPGVFVLLGAIALALKTNVQTVVQVPWRGVFPGFGWMALAVAAATAVRFRDSLRTCLGDLVAAARQPKNFALPLLIGMLLVRSVGLPAAGWDGRSIWIFLARRIHTQGMLLASDLTDPLTLWSHPEYPLLHPSWMAWFAGYETPFNERMAVAGVAALMAGLTWLIWRLARSAFGPYAGAAFTVTCVLLVDPLTVRGYADGFVAMLLAVEVLALARPETRGNDTVWWIAAMAASLTKTEGLLLAPAVALPFLLFHPHWTGRSWTRRIAFLAALVPAVAHRLWASTMGVNTILHGIGPVEMLTRLPLRLVEAVGLAPKLWSVDGYMPLRAALWTGLLSLIVAGIGLVLRRIADRVPSLVLMAALAAVAFAFVSIGGLPGKVFGLVGSALDRLLLHASIVAAIAALFVFADPGTGGRATVTVRPTPSGATSRGKRGKRRKRRTRP